MKWQAQREENSREISCQTEKAYQNPREEARTKEPTENTIRATKIEVAAETREQQMSARFSKLNPAIGSGSRIYQSTRISDLAGTEFSPVDHKRARGASSILSEPRRSGRLASRSR